MEKIFKVTSILLMFLLAFLVPVRAQPATVKTEPIQPEQFPTTYWCDGYMNQYPISLGIQGDLRIYVVNFPTPPPEGPIPAYWINLVIATSYNWAEGGLQAYYSPTMGRWYLRLYMSVDDNGVLKTIRQQDLGWPPSSQPYKIRLFRDQTNSKLWHMWVWRPGGTGWEAWQDYTYQNSWTGNEIYSQTEGNTQPSQGHSGDHVGDWCNLKYMDSNRNWVSWSSCEVRNPTAWHIRAIKENPPSPTAYHSYVDW